jgi:hypothetical protein
MPGGYGWAAKQAAAPAQATHLLSHTSFAGLARTFHTHVHTVFSCKVFPCRKIIFSTVCTYSSGHPCPFVYSSCDAELPDVRTSTGVASVKRAPASASTPAVTVTTEAGEVCVQVYVWVLRGCCVFVCHCGRYVCVYACEVVCVGVRVCVCV